MDSTDHRYDSLKLENQLCFPLYVASKEVIRKYKPLLDRIDLTYTQYIAMMVIWEKKKIRVTDLSASLFLDTGTVSPLIRKLAAKGYVQIVRSSADERVQLVELTEAGELLRDEALAVPKAMITNRCICLEPAEALVFRKLLMKVIQGDSGS